MPGLPLDNNLSMTITDAFAVYNAYYRYYNARIESSCVP